jgi:hypothetical protein
MDAVEKLADEADVIEVTSTFHKNAERDERWSASITTFENGAVKTPGSELGSGFGAAHSYIKATELAAENYKVKA